MSCRPVSSALDEDSVQVLNGGRMNASYFKDYVYPALDLILKLVIGVALAFLLHRRANADKIKERLIDTYLQFLDSQVKVSRGQVAAYEQWFYKALRKQLSSLDLPYDARSSVEEVVSEQEEKVNQTDITAEELEVSRFTAFTYRFCLLIGARRYFRRIRKHEDGLEHYLRQGGDAEGVANQIFDSLEFADPLTAFAKTVAERRAKQAVDELKTTYMKHALTRHERLNLELINPYSTAVARAIDRI